MSTPHEIASQLLGLEGLGPEEGDTFTIHFGANFETYPDMDPYDALNYLDECSNEEFWAVQDAAEDAAYPYALMGKPDQRPPRPPRGNA